MQKVQTKNQKTHRKTTLVVDKITVLLFDQKRFDQLDKIIDLGSFNYAESIEVEDAEG